MGLSNTRKLLVGLAQPLVRPGDVAANLTAALAMAQTAADRGAMLVLFSECAVTGYDHGGVGLAAALDADDPRLRPVQELADRRGIALVMGLHERAGRGVYNSAVIHRPHVPVLVHRKVNLAPLDARQGVLAGPEGLTLFEFRGFRLGVLICADSGRERIFERHAEAGCDAVLALTGGLGLAKDGFGTAELADPARLAAWRKAAPTVGISLDGIERSMKLRLGMACANQAGYDAEMGYFHCGHCTVFDSDGAITALIPGTFVFEHLRAQLAIGTITASRSGIPHP